METSTRSENKSEADPVMDLFPDEDNEERGKKSVRAYKAVICCFVFKILLFVF